ncbi:MAG TPA: M12 family metallo-peptidase [Gammaproteobacteria bacterium]
MRPSARSRLVAQWAAIALLAASSGAAAQDVTILHHETVPPFAATATTAGAAPGASGKPQPAAVPTWSFVAFGRQFDVELEPNDRLLLGLDPEHRARLEDVELYAGRLAGLPGSWVRIARHRGIVSGVIWDGTTLYAVETERRIARFAVNPSGEGNDVAIYRYADMLGGLRDEVIHTSGDAEVIRPSGDADAPSDAELLAAMTKPLPTPVGPGAQLDFAIVADDSFAAREGESAEATLLSILNIVDGIYVTQIGIHLGLVDLVLLDAPGPFTEADPPALLSQLAEYKSSNPTFRASGLAHLFTGRDLEEPEDSTGQLVGIANLGAICSARFGVGLTQATFPVLATASIAAHEIGHNFGAPHDAEEGSPCAPEPPRYLMAASVNGSRELSQCSIEEIAKEVATATCLTPLPPTDVTLQITEAPPAEVRLDQQVDVAFEIVNEGSATAQGLEVSIAYAGLGEPVFVEADGDTLLAQCVGTSPAYCRLPRLEPGERARYRLRFAALESGPQTIDIAVAVLNDADTSDNGATFTVDVLPGVDVAAEMGTAEVVVYPDEAVRLSGIARNIGTVDASGVIAELSVPYQYDVDGVDAGGADCVLVETGFVTRIQCRIGALAAGAARPISWTATPKPQHADVLGSFDADLFVSGAERESAATSGNNRASTRLVRTDAKSDLAMIIEAATSLRRGDPVELVVRLENRGPDEARQTIVTPGAANSLSEMIDSVSSSVGECTVPLPGSGFECRAERLAAGESMIITFAGTAGSVGDYRLDVFGGSANGDPDFANNSASHAFSVVEQTTEGPMSSGSGAGGGGGGGAAGFGALLGLLVAAAVRHRRFAQLAVVLAVAVGAACAARIATAQGTQQTRAAQGAQQTGTAHGTQRSATAEGTRHGSDGSPAREPSDRSAHREAESRPAAAVDLPDGDGKSLVQTACLVCHDLGGIAAFKGYWNREQWAAMVATMIEHGAELDPAEAEIVTDYLTAHFGIEQDRRVEQEQRQQRGTAE